jgi:hypothetical protein
MFINKLCIILLLPTCALAANNDAAPSASIPAAPSSLTDAKAQLARAAAMRREASTQRNEAEKIRIRGYNACNHTVLINACREEVRVDNVERLSIVRQMDIDANAIERNAKRMEVKENAATKQLPAPTGHPTHGAQHSAPAPQAQDTNGVPVARPAPSATVNPAAQARANAELKERVSGAAKQKQANATAAQLRAESAQKDRERYDKRIQDHAAKMAEKAKKQTPLPAASVPASH